MTKTRLSWTLLAALAVRALASCQGEPGGGDDSGGEGGAGTGGASEATGGRNTGGDAASGGGSGGEPLGGASSGGSGADSGLGGSLGGAPSGGTSSDGGTGGNGSGGSPSSASFITVWNTDPETVPPWVEGPPLVPATDATTLMLPLVPDGTYDFTVWWGDGSSSLVTSHDDVDIVHEYDESGEYTLVIDGTLEGWAFPVEYGSDAATDAIKLSRVEQWGSFRFGQTAGAFSLAANLVITAEDTPDLSAPTTLDSAFSLCRLLGTSGGFGEWDLSEVTSTRAMFFAASTFDEDLASWDVSGVTDMSQMFSYATDFNQDLSIWDVSSVTTMREMFMVATAFNGDLSGWDVSSVTTMRQMFWQATSFNGDVSTWEPSSVTNMSSMFYGASAFDGDLSSWDVSSVLNMSSMFYGASAFDGDLSSWDVSSVTNMDSMFRQAISFNRSLGSWDVGAVAQATDMLAQSGISTSNYDALLNGWASQTTLDDVPFGAGAIQYSAAGQTARGVLTTRGWTIADGGLAP